MKAPTETREDIGWTGPRGRRGRALRGLRLCRSLDRPPGAGARRHQQDWLTVLPSSLILGAPSLQCVLGGGADFLQMETMKMAFVS